MILHLFVKELNSQHRAKKNTFHLSERQSVSSVGAGALCGEVEGESVRGEYAFLFILLSLAFLACLVKGIRAQNSK